MLRFKTVAAACMLMQCIVVNQAAAQQTPNIIVILADDLGYNDVGFNGCKDIPTPNIDRIAKQGVICTNAYVTFAVCGPSRAGILTGRYQDRFGFSKNPLLAPKDSLMGLPASEQTIAAYLKQSRYATGIMGKWHMGTHPTHHPNKKGFDTFFGFLEGGHNYFPEEWDLDDVSDSKSQYHAYKTKLLYNNEVVEEKEYLTDALSREGSRFIKQNTDHPFFLYLAYNAPHTPMQATEKYLSRFTNIANSKRKTYAAMVSAMDDGVGLVLNTLEEAGLINNTIIFFLSDNGGPVNDNASNNNPLRGKKGDFYDGGIRVPFAVQWKGKLPAGIKYDYPVSSLDIFGTAAAVTGIQPLNKLDGINLIPYLSGQIKTAPHEMLFWRGSDNEKWAVRSVSDKVVIVKEEKQFYNIVNDVSEQNNLSPDNNGQQQKLHNALNDWKKKLVAPLFLGLLDEEAYNKLHPDRFTKTK